MEEALKPKFWCKICKIKFLTKSVYDLHLSLVHDPKQKIIKKRRDSNNLDDKIEFSSNNHTEQPNNMQKSKQISDLVPLALKQEEIRDHEYGLDEHKNEMCKSVSNSEKSL